MVAAVLKIKNGGGQEEAPFISTKVELAPNMFLLYQLIKGQDIASVTIYKLGFIAKLKMWNLTKDEARAEFLKDFYGK